MPEYQITSIDYWEHDAFLIYEGQKYYFQFGDEGPSLEEALHYLFSEGRIKIIDK